MGSYVNGSLLSGEQVAYEAKLSFWPLLPLVVIGLLLLPLFGLGLVFWLGAFIRYRTTELAVTNKRVIAKVGFISRRTVELNLSRVEGILVNQGIVGRILDYGSIIVSGTGGMKEPIAGISNPIAFRQAFSAAQDAVGVPV